MTFFGAKSKLTVLLQYFLTTSPKSEGFYAGMDSQNSFILV